MKTIKALLVFAIWLSSQIVLVQAASANSAQGVQINAEGPPTPLLYRLYVTPGGVVPEAPFNYAATNLFAALQTATEKSGPNGGVSYSFSITNKFGASLVSQFTIEWWKNGNLVETRAIAGQEQVLYANWLFAATQAFGKNTAILRNDFVNNILGASTGAPQARFPAQMFTIDGPGLYTVRIWATVDGKPVFLEQNRDVLPYYIYF